MFPLYDDNPTEIFPLVTLLIMGVTVAVWVFIQGAGFSPEALMGSVIPMVGASGAISAIMGAYLVLYPKAKVHTLFILIIIIRVFQLPAWFFLLYWFFIQVASSSIQSPGGGGGVAFWAHIGGFVAGLALVKLFQNPALVHAKRSGALLHRRDLKGGGWW